MSSNILIIEPNTDLSTAIFTIFCQYGQYSGWKVAQWPVQNDYIPDLLVVGIDDDSGLSTTIITARKAWGEGLKLIALSYSGNILSLTKKDTNAGAATKPFIMQELLELMDVMLGAVPISEGKMVC